jgi:hypothetical protein
MQSCHSHQGLGRRYCLRLHSTLHTRQSSIQNNKYRVSHRYGIFSWWWAHSRPKHVEKRNKHIKKNCAPRWLYLQDFIHCNLKMCIVTVVCCWSCIVSKQTIPVSSVAILGE